MCLNKIAGQCLVLCPWLILTNFMSFWPCQEYPCFSIHAHECIVCCCPSNQLSSVKILLRNLIWAQGLKSFKPDRKVESVSSQILFAAKYHENWFTGCSNQLHNTANFVIYCKCYESTTRWTFFRVKLVFECEFEISWSLGLWDLGTPGPLHSSNTSSYFPLPPLTSS